MRRSGFDRALGTGHNGVSRCASSRQWAPHLASEEVSGVTPSTLTVAEQRLALAVEAARLGSWTWDMAAGTTTWDERLEEMHGLPPGGFGGTFEDWLAALHPDDREECIARVTDALEHRSSYMLLHRTTWPDGSLHTIECRGTVLVDPDGRPTGTTGVAIDVTGREELVQTLQQSLLPTALPSVPGVTLTTRYRAAESRTPIGGDWYAAIALPDGRMAVAIGDVAGHGLEAVADMAAARFSLRALALIDSQPDVVLDRLNQVVRVFENDALITVLYGVLDPHEHTWTYASAGHVPALVRTADGTTSLLRRAARPAPRNRACVPCPPGAGARRFDARAVHGRIDRATGRVTRPKAVGASKSSARPRRPSPKRSATTSSTRCSATRPNEDDIAILAVTLTGDIVAGLSRRWHRRRVRPPLSHVAVVGDEHEQGAARQRSRDADGAVAERVGRADLSMEDDVGVVSDRDPPADARAHPSCQPVHGPPPHLS